MNVRIGRRSMSGTEVAYRFGQEVSKWIDRLRLDRHPIGPIEWTGRGAAAASSPAAIEAFQEGAAQRFFAGPGTEVGRLCRDFGDAERTVMARAQELRRHRFDLLGYRALSFDDPIDWHRDPISCRRAPLIHWSRLNPLDVETVGDHKVIWELNRHQWIVTLAQAAWLTGDPDYARSAIDGMADWIRANPYGRGINWASSLEVAVRLMSWSWTLVLLRRMDLLTPDVMTKILASMRAHARHVERYLSYYFSPNTHLTGEALSLLYAGLLLGHAPESDRWCRLGRQILVDECQRQITVDGVYAEQATCYHRYTIEIYLQFLILAERNGMSVPDAVRDRVILAVDYLLVLCQPRGEMPNIGDADGGWLLPLVRREPSDCRGVFGLAASFFGRADYAWAAGGVTPEVAWMMGDQGCARIEALQPAPPVGPVASRAFTTGGYAVLQSGWDAEAHQLILDAGPLGATRSTAHGHADLLSIQVRAFGDEYLVDPGTYAYTVEPDWRDHFRSTAAHSTILVDGHGQAEPLGPFSWHRAARAQLQAWRSTQQYDYADAHHDAYAALPSPVRHRRRIVFIKPHLFVMLDDVMGSGHHELCVNFQFSARPVAAGPSPWVAASGLDHRGLWLAVFTPDRCEPVVHAGLRHPKAGWVSSLYGERHPAPVVGYPMIVKLPIRLLTLIVPSPHLTRIPPNIEIDRGADGSVRGLRARDWDETLEFDDAAIVRVGGAGREVIA